MPCFRQVPGGSAADQTPPDYCNFELRHARKLDALGAEVPVTGVSWSNSDDTQVVELKRATRLMWD